MHSLVSMHITYRSHTQSQIALTHTRTRTDTCNGPRACEHDDAEDEVLYDPRRRGNGTQMLELFTLNLRDDVREANARGKMQNTECET